MERLGIVALVAMTVCCAKEAKVEQAPAPPTEAPTAAAGEPKAAAGEPKAAAEPDAGAAGGLLDAVCTAPEDLGAISARLGALVAAGALTARETTARHESTSSGAAPCPNGAGVSAVDVTSNRGLFLSATVALCPQADGSPAAEATARRLADAAAGKCWTVQGDGQSGAACLLPKSCVIAQGATLSVAPRPAMPCHLAERKIDQQSDDRRHPPSRAIRSRYRAPVASAEVQEELVRDLATVDASRRTQVLGNALGRWEMGFYGAEVRRALEALDTVSPEQLDEALFHELEPMLVEDLGCAAAIEGLATLEPAERAVQLAASCPPAGSRLVTQAEAQGAELGSVLLRIAMEHDAALYGLRDSKLHAAALAAVRGLGRGDGG